MLPPRSAVQPDSAAAALPADCVEPLTSLTQALSSTPSSTSGRTVAPSFTKPVTPPPFAERSKKQFGLQDRTASPQPPPRPIQNPSRVWGCCAAPAALASSASETTEHNRRGVTCTET